MVVLTNITVGLVIWTLAAVLVFLVRNQLEPIFQRSRFALSLFLVVTLPIGVIALIGLALFDKAESRTNFEQHVRAHIEDE